MTREHLCRVTIDITCSYVNIRMGKQVGKSDNFAKKKTEFVVIVSNKNQIKILSFFFKQILSFSCTNAYILININYQ